MADDDMNEQYFDDEDDFDWFYVEENYPLADELAETSVPDPGYAGTNAELDYSWYDFDIYEYWDDLEYGHDSYWDTAGTAVAGQKRKRAEGAAKVQKRMKLSLKEVSGGTTMFVSMADRRKLWSRRAPVKKGLKIFALLPDWQKKCAKADTKMSVKAMPAEMRQAAEANEQDTPEGARHFDAEAMDEEEGDWEDEDAEEQLGPVDMDAVITDMAQIANIDMDALQAVLRQKLGESGLATMDEGKFMETMQRMLSGDTNTDDAAGDLANSLLGTVRQEDSAFEGWLSQQGVSLDQAEEEEDAESVATAEMPESSSRSRKGKSVQTSPPDSAIEMAKGGRTAQLAMHDGSPKAAKKRLAEIEQESDGSGRKRKKVTFDVPASQDLEAVTTAGEDQAAAMDVGRSNDEPLTSATTATPNEPASSENSLISEPTETAKPTRAKARVTKAPPTAESNATTAPKSKPSKPKAEPVLAASGPAKSTRKRKAETADEEPPPSKKQTRKAAAAAKGEDDGGGPSYARATRSTRARSGK